MKRKSLHVLRGFKALVCLSENECDFGIHKQLGMSRSTLWAAINELERETGLVFVSRKKQHNMLTEEGRNFIPYAQHMLRLFEEGIAEASNFNAQEPVGEVIISTTTAVAGSWLMESIAAFQVLYPKIQLKIIADDHLSTATERLADILLRPMDRKDFLVCHWFIPYKMALWASEDYLERCGVPETPEDLRGHSVLGYGEYAFSYFPDIDWHLKGRWGALPRITPRLTVNSTSSLYLAAQQGLGICSAADQANAFYRGNLIRVLPDLEGPTTYTYCCTKKEASPLSKRNTEIFRNFFTNYLESHGIKIQQAD